MGRGGAIYSDSFRTVSIVNSTLTALDQ